MTVIYLTDNNNTSLIIFNITSQFTMHQNITFELITTKKTLQFISEIHGRTERYNKPNEGYDVVLLLMRSYFTRHSSTRQLYVSGTSTFLYNAAHKQPILNML